MHNNRNPLRRRASLLAAVAGVSLLGLAACGGDDDTSAAENPSTTAATSSDTTADSPPTDPPTTDAPTTDAPTTEAPTTEAPADPELIEVTAKDFGFEGVPEELEAGTYSFHFANTGTEPHELLVFRNKENLSLEELFALGPDEGAKHVDMAVFAQAGPGTSTKKPAVAELTPGEYEVVCFIPTPTDGQPHFEHGMHTKITVR